MDAFHTLATFKHEQLAAADAAADSEKEGSLDAVKAAGGWVCLVGRLCFGCLAGKHA